MNVEDHQKYLDRAVGLVMGDYTIGNISTTELAELLYKMETEKREKEELSDSLLDYNDEIVNIEPVGVVETIDITVTGDNLFYCNGILTKNSIGLPNILDLYLGIISSEEADENNEIHFKQIKNRYRDENLSRRFACGRNKARMQLWDINSNWGNQNKPQQSAPLSTGNKSPSFSGFQFD